MKSTQVNRYLHATLAVMCVVVVPSCIKDVGVVLVKLCSIDSVFSES